MATGTRTRYRIVFSLKNGKVFATDGLMLSPEEAAEMTRKDLKEFLEGSEIEEFTKNGIPVLVRPDSVAMAMVETYV